MGRWNPLNGCFGQIQDGGMKWHELLGLRTLRKSFTRICRIRGSSYFAKQTPGYCLFKFVCFWQYQRIRSKREVAGEGRQQVKGQEVVSPIRLVEKSKMLTFFGASVRKCLVFRS